MPAFIQQVSPVAEPLGQKHYRNLGDWTRELRSIEKQVELDAGGKPTQKTKERLVPYVNSLAERLGRVGPCPRWQTYNAEILKKTAWVWRENLVPFIRSEIEEDKLKGAVLLQEYAWSLCHEYGMPRASVTFDRISADDPRRWGETRSQPDGSGTSIKIFWNPKDYPGKPKRPALRIATMTHEDVHAAQARLLINFDLNRRFPLTRQYLGFSRAILDSPKLNFLYYHPQLYRLMPMEQDAVMATNSLSGFFRYVDKLTQKQLVEVPRRYDPPQSMALQPCA